MGQYVLSDDAQRILEALENPKYQWRTLDGLARETGIAPDKISGILAGALSTEVLTTRDKSGSSLYTTRGHYRHSQGLLNRLLTALSDQIR